MLIQKCSGKHIINLWLMKSKRVHITVDAATSKPQDFKHKQEMLVILTFKDCLAEYNAPRWRRKQEKYLQLSQ